MKKTILILIAILSFSTLKAQSKEYGKGTVIFVTYNIETKEEVTNEKYADLIKLIKNEDSYELFCEDANGKFSIVFKTIKGLKNEEIDVKNQYIDDDGYVYLIKDLLDSPVKAFDALNTVELPNTSDKYRMILRVIIK